MISFHDQVKKDLDRVFFNTEEFAETATLATSEGESTIRIVRGGETDRMSIDPGQGDTDSFTVSQAEYALPVPNDIITVNEIEWIVQPGAALDPIMGVWTVPVASGGRVRA